MTESGPPPSQPTARPHPAPAELAATLLCGTGAARLRPAAGEDTWTDVLHGLASDGALVLVVPGHQLVLLGLDRHNAVPARVTVTATAPLPDVVVRRAAADVTGQLRLVLSPSRGLLQDTVCLGHDLLDAAASWTGAAVARLVPDRVHVHGGGGCAVVNGTHPSLRDPLAGEEVDLIHIIDRRMGPDLLSLVRTQTPAQTVRTVGVDRYGVTLLAEDADSAQTVRLPFPAPAADPDCALRMVIATLVGFRRCRDSGCGGCGAGPFRDGG